MKIEMFSHPSLGTHRILSIGLRLGAPGLQFLLLLYLGGGEG